MGKAVPREKRLAQNALAGDRYAAALFIKSQGCKTITDVILAMCPTGKVTFEQFEVLADGFAVVKKAAEMACVNAVLRELEDLEGA